MAGELIPPTSVPDLSEETLSPNYAGVETPPADGLYADRQTARDQSPARALARPAAFSVADGLMALVGVAAAVLRFGELGRLPLSAAEATAALASWQFWSAAPETVPVISPAYFTFTNLVMALDGGSDAAARLVPAVFGLLTVLLPWLWRGQVRPAVYLAAGLFLAVSPILVTVSRTAGGDSIALFALMLLVVAGLQLRDGGRHEGGRGWALAAGAGLGLGLTSSPLFYTGLVALISAAVVARAFQPAGGRRLESLRYVAISAAVVFLAVASSLLLHPAGIGAALRLFPAWLAQFGLPAAGNASPAAALLSPLLALLRYEPAVIVLGVPAMVWAVLRYSRRDPGGRRGLLLTVWFGLTVLIMLLQSGYLVNAAAALLPGYLLVGLMAASLATGIGDDWLDSRRTTLSVAGGLVLLGMLLLAAVGRFARLGLLTGANATLITLMTLAFVLAGLTVILALAWESTAARRGAFLGAALLLLFWQWGAAHQLSRLGANDPRERWVVAGTDDDTRVMVDLLARVSRQTANSDRDLTIFSEVDSPILGWYLRDYENFSAGPTLPLGTQAAVIITPADAEPQLPNDYFGADFGLEQREIAGGPSSPADALKWWLFRESTAPVEEQRVVVWIRSDLAAPE